MQITNQVEDWKAKQAAKAVLVAQLQKAHPHLIPTGQQPDCVVAAKNIRIELKAAFPGVKFSVNTKRYTGGNSINVHWIDGPTVEQVEEITRRYKAGNFDGMTDSYNFNDNLFGDAFGDAMYIFAERKHSDRAVEAAIRTVFTRYAGNLKDVARPTVQEFRSGNLYRVDVPYLNTNLQGFISTEAHRRTWALRAK